MKNSHVEINEQCNEFKRMENDMDYKKGFNKEIEVILRNLLNSSKTNSENIEQTIINSVNNINFLAHAYRGDYPYKTAELLNKIDWLCEQQEYIDRKIDISNQSIIEVIRNELSEQKGVCRLNDSNSKDRIFELIVAGGPSWESREKGKSEADDYLETWIKSSNELIIADPFLFKRERVDGEEETEDVTRHRDQLYADTLLDVIGSKKKVEFIYKGNPEKKNGGPTKVTQGVANRIADRLSALELRTTFHVVEDLHDRVWLKKDAKNIWTAKVIGTSRGGIGKRPTYIIDMSPSDCAKYFEYIHYLRNISQKSHERPIDYKKIRAQKKKAGEIK